FRLAGECHPEELIPGMAAVAREESVLDPAALIIDRHLVLDVTDPLIAHLPGVALGGANDLRVEPVSLCGDRPPHQSGALAILVDHGKRVVHDDFPVTLAQDTDAANRCGLATRLHHHPFTLCHADPALRAEHPGLSLPLSFHRVEHAERMILRGNGGWEGDGDE